MGARSSNPLRFAYLGSGSKGNAALIESGGTCVMLDCGFSVAETERRLARLGRAPQDISAILVTHEHGDHIAGVARFARRHDIAVWMTPGTFAAAGCPDLPRFEPLDCHQPFTLGDLEVVPFPVPHDAREPCQYRFGDGARGLGVVTDAGHVTPHMQRCLDGCRALAVECNHDSAMLAAGPYPPSVKARVGSRLGHLSNAQAAELAAGAHSPALHHLVGVHLSEVNNTPALARQALAAAVGGEPGEVLLADQGRGLDWLSLA